MLADMTAPVLTLSAAATATGLSQSTLRRKRAEMLKAGARQTEKGAWEIPVPVLIQLGLMPATTAPDSPPVESVEAFTAPTTQTPMETLTAPLRAEVEALRAELAEAKQRAAVAEAVGIERERLLQAKQEIISVQAQALRMLEMAPEQPQVREPAEEKPTAVSEPAVTPSVTRDASRDAQPVIAESRKKWWHVGRN